jgi:hypothetical protein
LKAHDHGNKKIFDWRKKHMMILVHFTQRLKVEEIKEI